MIVFSFYAPLPLDNLLKKKLFLGGYFLLFCEAAIRLPEFLQKRMSNDENQTPYVGYTEVPDPFSQPTSN